MILYKDQERREREEGRGGGHNKNIQHIPKMVVRREDWNLHLDGQIISCSQKDRGTANRIFQQRRKRMERGDAVKLKQRCSPCYPLHLEWGQKVFFLLNPLILVAKLRKPIVNSFHNGQFGNVETGHNLPSFRIIKGRHHYCWSRGKGMAECNFVNNLVRPQGRYLINFNFVPIFTSSSNPYLYFSMLRLS